MENVSAVLITRENKWPEKASLGFPFGQTIIDLGCPNVIRRFYLAAEAKYEHVYVQDDDCEIDIERLWKEYCRVGKNCITNAIGLGHQQIYAGTNVTLIGFGSFFPRSFAQGFLHDLRAWVDKFGADIVETECDRMFTWQFRPWHSVNMPIREFRRTYCMSNRPGHYQLRDRIIKELNT